MNSDEDDDLARAIALSLEEAHDENRSNGRTRHPAKGKAKTRSIPAEVVVISDDEDEEEAQGRKSQERGKDNRSDVPKNLPSVQPMASSSKAPVAVPPPAQFTPPQPTPLTEPTPPTANLPAGAGLLSLLGDRAQMERERLARQKRLRGPSPPAPPPVSSGEEDLDDDEEDEDEDMWTASEGSSRKRVRLNSAGDSASRGGPSQPPTFLDGVLRRVETKYAEAGPGETGLAPGVRLSELIGPKDELAFAILSAFVIDPSWIYSFFDPTTPVILVADSNTTMAESSSSRPTLKNIFPNWVRVCPPLGNRGCMHMKYMLFFKKTGALRVVISSANLVPHDWRDVENYVFVQDVPRLRPAADFVRLRTGEKPGEAFPSVLAGVLRATGVEAALAIMEQQGRTDLPLPTLIPSTVARGKPKISALESKWDWSRVRAALVPSVPGRWEGWAGDRAVLLNGQTRLLRAIQNLGCGLDPEKGKRKTGDWEIELDCLTSSIGTYTPPWTAVFRLCAGGRSRAIQAWLDRGRKKTPKQGPTRILYPTLETIKGTKMGEPGAGTIFCRRAQWTKISGMASDASGLEIHDVRSRSGPLTMHTKMILGTLKGPPADDSATESDTDSDIEVIETGPIGKPRSWLYVGSHNFTPSAWGRLSGSGFNPVLEVMNYELGVVMRLETEAEENKAIAWARPTRRYVKDDVPWIQEESPFFAE
ncbi:unnamed protein product [Mycena citricolor]|uniref:Phospholipase D/nuclease n=1 Tax=Mycena citricolor TaxID=2018698 RepID=A0AAD2HLA7_9AGAR|nr:unnamed protein product [Mycena citricolor]